MSDLQHRALIVTAADYNGAEFDGQPVKPLYPLKSGETVVSVAPWFFEAIKAGKILIEARGHTDYAWFGVKDDYNNVHWAGPGDMIARDMGYITVIPAAAVKYIERLCRDIELPLGLARDVKITASALQLAGMYRPLGGN
jgi:hypothetical protein